MGLFFFLAPRRHRTCFRKDKFDLCFKQALGAMASEGAGLETNQVKITLRK